MQNAIKFAVIGDCHYSEKQNYGQRDCLGANNRLSEIIDELNLKQLDFVFSMGDLGDGHSKDEALTVLETFKKSKYPVKFAVGNHDLVMRSEDDHMKLAGMPAPNYCFLLGGVKFIVLNPFEMSIYSRSQEDRNAYWLYRKQNPDTPVQQWPGLFKDNTWSWLKETLENAKNKSEKVIIFCHVPVLDLACLRLGSSSDEPLARIIEHDRMLNLMDEYKNILAYFAGHYHQGGLAVRNGVVHKTVRSVCDYSLPTACIVTVDENMIKLEGLGTETNFVYKYE